MSQTHVVKSPKQGIDYWVFKADTVAVQRTKLIPLWYIKAYTPDGAKVDSTSTLIAGFRETINYAKKLASLSEYPNTGLYYEQFQFSFVSS